jgi:hypothetical protein
MDEQQFFPITIIEGEPIVQPSAMVDDLGRETVVLMAVGE